MKKARHGQPRRGGVNRDGQVHLCPFGGGALGSHRGDQVALLRSLGVRGSEGIGSGDTRSSQLTRAHLGRLNAQVRTRYALVFKTHYFAVAFLKTILYHHDPRHQSVVVRIVPPATTNPPKINPHTGSP